MKIDSYLVNAFGRSSLEGNPAGVVLNADAYSSQLRQKIAAKLGYSETAFVSKLEDNKLDIDFYTPVAKIPNCGHATVATLSLLSSIGHFTSEHVAVNNDLGTTHVELVDDKVHMRMPAAEYFDFSKADQVKLLYSLGLSSNSLMSDSFASIVSSGNKFLMVPLSSIRELHLLTPDFKLIHQLSEKYGLVGIYAFALTDDASVPVQTRMFAPAYGINEESATGMAAAPLAYHLYVSGLITTKKFTIGQGYYMDTPRLSHLYAELLFEGDKINEVIISGSAFLATKEQVCV